MKASKGLRLHIALFGKRNAGKSSLINSLTRQDVSIVSEEAGTTTDPVEKPMEVQPLGPVLFIDTAGIDDVGALGDLRVEKTKKIFDRADVGVIVAQCGEWGDFEESLLSELEKRKLAALIVFNKNDITPPAESLVNDLKKRGLAVVSTNAAEGLGMDDFREALVDCAPADHAPPVLSDLVPAGEMAVLVVPIDMEAPKGRLILPQVQAIRELLDGDSYCMVVKERELRDALNRLKTPPALVITDSQAFLKVGADTPKEIPMTSFSILFARAKGDLEGFVRGALAIEKLKPGSKVLICESCSHHPIGEDIGRVKIPRWLTQYAGGKLNIEHVQGHDFPEDPTGYELIIQCGGCMQNRAQILRRQRKCAEVGVPVTNYGIAISYVLGIFERALAPFGIDIKSL